MVADDIRTVFDLGFGTDRLKMTAVPRPRIVPGETRTFDLALDARALPFSGRVEQIVLEDDLRFFATNLARMTVPGEVVLGGERMPELILSVEPQIGADAGMLAVEASMTATGDAWPRLTMLLFEQEAFWFDAAETLRGIVDEPVG